MQTLSRFLKDTLALVDAVAAGFLIRVLDAPIPNPLDVGDATLDLDGRASWTGTLRLDSPQVEILAMLTAVSGPPRDGAPRRVTRGGPDLASSL